MANTGPNLDSDLPPNVCHGESQILDFTGRALNRAGGTEECLVTAPVDLVALRRRRAGARFGFLTEFCPAAHAPIYAAAQGWPLDAFAAAPMGSSQENGAVQRRVHQQMCESGLLPRP
jgi:hypothetical protein